MKDEEIIKTFEVIKKSGELVFEHYKAGGFKNSLIEVWDRPGLGVTFNDKARQYVSPEDQDFFD